MLAAENLGAMPTDREDTAMSANQWPWSLAEEAEWEQELRQEEFGWMDELIDHMISDALAGPSYDPLQPQDEWSEEEVAVP